MDPRRRSAPPLSLAASRVLAKKARRRQIHASPSPSRPPASSCRSSASAPGKCSTWATTRKRARAREVLKFFAPAGGRRFLADVRHHRIGGRRPLRRARLCAASSSSRPRSGRAAARRASGRWRLRSGACASSRWISCRCITCWMSTAHEDAAGLEGERTRALHRHHALHRVRVRRGRALLKTGSTTSCRSTIRSPSAKPRSGFCRSRARSKVAVIANRPFAEGALSGACGQAAARLGGGARHRRAGRNTSSSGSSRHPAVTCAIPGTGKPEHIADNVAAGSAPLPDEAMRKRMAEHFDSL